MIKKALCLIILCIIYTSSSVLAAEETLNLSLYLGDTINLNTYLESNSLNIDLTHNTTFQNANPQIAMIDSDYNIESLSVGETIIVISDNDKLTPITIEVKSPIKTISIDNSDITLLAGEIYSLNYELIPQDDYAGIIPHNLKWRNSKNNIAGVKGHNTIYTYGVGTTTLTGTAFDGSTTVNITIKVIGNPDPLVIKPIIVDSKVNVGEQRQLKAYFGEKDVTSNIIWKSEYPDLVSISKDGIITPLKEGTCKITATSAISRKKDSYTFFVKSMVDTIKLNHTSITLSNLGDTVQLNATLVPKNDNIMPLRNGYYFTSSNPSIAAVDEDGLVVAKEAGIALISVTSYDSGKKDYCTIEIPNNSANTSIDYTLVDDITLDPYTPNILIGQKVLMDYEILPTDASNDMVKFHVKNGGAGQIHYIDNRYYFVPTKRGINEIKIVANSDSDSTIEDEISVAIVSPIASVELDLELKRGTTTNRKLYIGEKTELLTNIFTQGNYSAYDVYPNTLVYTVDDPDILKLTYENGHYFITALKKGTTSIRVVNVENKHHEHLKISVSNPTKSLFTDKAVKLPVGIDYSPRINYIPKIDLEDYIMFDITQGITLNVNEFYFSKSFIKNELDYENEVINYFETLSYNPSVEATIKRHKERLSRLSNLYNSTTDDYCLVNNNFLKDRNFNTYQYYSIDNNKIKGFYPGKANVLVSLNNTASKATTTIYWENNNDIFEIQNTSKWVNYETLINDYQLHTTLSDLSTSEQIEHLIFYLSNPSLFDNLPTQELLSALMTIDTDELPYNLTHDLNALTTKQELAFIAMYLDKDKAPISAFNLNKIIYYDVINEQVKQALANQYVVPNSVYFYGIDDNITYYDFKTTVDKIRPINELTTSSNLPMTHRQVLLWLYHLNN